MNYQIVCWHTYIQTDRQTDRKRDRQTKRQTDRQTDRQKDRQTERQTDRKKGRRTHRQKIEETHRHTDRKSERQNDRPTDIHTTEAETEIHKSSSVQKLDNKFCFEWFLDRPAWLVGYNETLVKNTLLSQRRSTWSVHILKHSPKFNRQQSRFYQRQPALFCNSISTSSSKCLFFLP